MLIIQYYVLPEWLTLTTRVTLFLLGKEGVKIEVVKKYLSSLLSELTIKV